MTVYVDSADRRDIHAAAQLGFVKGVTTNPSLMRTVTDDPLRHLKELLTGEELTEFYYQPCGAYADLREEAEAAWSLAPGRVIVKSPATPGGVALASRLAARGVPVALTAAQTPNAMIVAEATGCVAVIPYVDRAWRDPRTENELVAALARVRRGTTRIVAASVKNAGQFTRAFSDGADAVTAPLAVLRQVLDHPSALEAERDFAAEYRAERAGEGA
ncbi:transaldolase family protein [Sphaerisporangium dianthi]|uniref:Transaldolase family protein n=1 Tax=Sphaerisporangium dianthi TaxID=1436120 RepID=A0ABV9CKJ7_9ACTN